MDLRICGAFRSLPYAAFVALLRRTAFAAFAGALVTGSLLFSVKAGTLGHGAATSNHIGKKTGTAKPPAQSPA